jgi:hypothetical protein
MKNRVDRPFTADNTAPQPQQVGAGPRFIDKQEPRPDKYELLSPPAAACVGHVRPELFGGAQVIFFEGNMSSKALPDSVGLPAMRRLRIAATISSSVKTGCSATTARSSNGGCDRLVAPGAPSRNMRQGVAEVAQRKRTQCPIGVVNPTVRIVRFRTPSIDPLAYVLAMGRYSRRLHQQVERFSTQTKEGEISCPGT